MARRLKIFYQSFPLVELLLKLPPSCLRFPDWRFIFTEMADPGVDVIGEKRYLCQYCDRIFTSPQAFGGHQNGHKKEKENLKKFQREANQFLAMQHAQQQPPPPRTNVIQPIPLMHHPSPMNMHQNNYHIHTPPPHLIPNNGYLHSNSQPFGFYNNTNGAARFETLYSSPYNISHGHGDGGGGGGGAMRNATYERIATLNREYYGVAGPSTAVNNGRGANIHGDDGSKFNANKEGDDDEIDLTLRL